MTGFHCKLMLAVGHLLMVACGAARLLPPRADNLPVKGLCLYGAYSGANNGYAFFAPGVASRWQVRFSLYPIEPNGELGQGWTAESVDENANREVQLRVGTILGMFVYDNSRKHLAAGWAARLFAQHPEARIINAQVQFYEIPTMERFRDGERPEWHTVAFYSFSHNIKDDPEQE